MSQETTLINKELELRGVKEGDIVRRIWGDGFLSSELQVDYVDDEFIYCDRQRAVGNEEWNSILKAEQERWKFDKVYGVETDETQHWGVSYGLMLSRIEPL